MTSFSNDGDDYSNLTDTKSGDAEELQEFLALEQQKREMRVQVHQMTDMCWDKCIEKPQSKLDSKTETCLTNCVSRFVDVSLLITNRFAQVLQKAAQGGM